MTVRTKAGLANQIAALLADNDLRDITEGDARSVVTDIVDSMALESALTPGAVGSGMPTFSAGALTYDGAANEITGDLTNFAAMPPLPSLIVAVMPADIDRQAEDLRMTLNLRDFALQNVAGDPVRARDLTPGCAHLILRSSAGYRLLDPLGLRPQDWPFVSGAATYVPGQPPLTEAQADAFSVSTANSDFSTPAGFDVTTDFWYIGVPVSNIPPMARFVFLPGETTTFGSVRTSDPADDLPLWSNPEYMGMPFAWRYMSGIPTRPVSLRLLYDYANY